MLSSNGNNGRLDSWKDIAAYLRRDVRTAIRWEKEKGLPVRRVPGGQRKAVFAYTAELDSWLTQEGPLAQGTTPEGLRNGSGAQIGPISTFIPEAGFRKSRLRYQVLVAAATLSVLLFLFLGPRSRASQPRFPVRVDFTLNAVQAFDDRDHLLWTHTFPGTLNAASTARTLTDLSRIGDFRGKGDREVLVVAPLHVGLNAEDPTQAQVDLFSSRGELLWSYIPQGRFQFGKHELSGPWMVGDIFVSSTSGKPQIWLAVMHLVWGNSFVVNLDPATGKDTLRFVNTGTIRALNEMRTPRADLLLVGGFNNESDTGSLAAIDESKLFAASPQSQDSRHKCLSCPPGDPDYYFVFPRSEINQLQQAHDDPVIELHVTGDQIEVRKKELTAENGPQTIYLLRAEGGLGVISLRFESTYDMLHRKLERQGKISHSLDHCPERLNPKPIRMWTPASGWAQVQLPPTRADE